MRHTVKGEEGEGEEEVDQVDVLGERNERQTKPTLLMNIAGFTHNT